MSKLLQATRSGDRRSMLEALRDKLAYDIETCGSGRDVAALSKRLLEVVKELDSLPSADAPKTRFDRAREKARRNR